MIAFDILLGYIASVFLLIATPGPVVILVIRNASLYGFKSALFTSIGTNFASLILISISIAIIAGALNISESLLHIISIFGCLFICYLGGNSLFVNFKERRSKKKESIKTMLWPIILWLIGYVGMWFAKWILASIILNINAFDYVIEYAKKRINGTEFVSQNYILETIPRNFKMLFPIKFLLDEEYFYFIIGILIVFEIIFIRKKEIKKLWFSLILLLISLLPYIRYLVLANHSYLHSFFTFRSQIITIMAIILAITYSLDERILNYKMVRRNENGVNNINTMFK